MAWSPPRLLGFLARNLIFSLTSPAIVVTLAFRRAQGAGQVTTKEKLMKRQRWTTGIRILLLTAAFGFGFSSADADFFVGSGPPGPSQVVRYDNSGNLVGLFIAGDPNLNTPRGLAFGPDGNFYVCSINSNQVLRYDGTAGTFIDAFVPASGGLKAPEVSKFGSDGFLYVSNFGTNPTTNNQGMQVNGLDGQVTRYNASTGVLDSVFATSADIRGNVDGIVFGPNGDLFVTSLNRNSPDVPGVLEFDGTTGALKSQFTQGTNLFLPRDIAFGPDGNLYVVDIGNNAAGDSRVARFDGTSGQYIDDYIPFGSSLYVSRGLAFGPDGRLYVSGEPPASSNEPYGLIWAFDGMTLSIFIDSNTDGSNVILPTHFVFSP
jgi:sugar lactone lactonase YvrE